MLDQAAPDSYGHLIGVMAPGCGGASMADPLHRTRDEEVLPGLQVSASIHFHKTLVRRSNLRSSYGERLAMPVWFVKEHADKFEEWVILRTLSSTKPWAVHLGVARRKNGSPHVCFQSGWSNFALENRLQEGDSLIFALIVDARSEFRVHIFRGVTNSRTPAGKEKLSKAEERQQILGDSPSQEIESEYAQLSKGVATNQRRGSAPQSGAKSNPSFRKRLICYKNKLAQDNMEVPAKFVKTHGMPKQLRAVVELQGVHQESSVRTVTCQWWGKGGKAVPRLFFTDGWSGFVKENGLKAGQELNFTLTSDFFFVVRVVV